MASVQVPRVLINAANLRVGGGVQVAVSFIFELSKMSANAARFDLVVSSCVHDNLQECGFDSSVFLSYRVFDSCGAFSFLSGFSRSLSKYDLVFTIFGPLYSFSKPRISLVGFAQAWIAYPDTEAYQLLPLYARVKTRIKFLLQKFMFARADHLVVELEHVRRQLIDYRVAGPDRISVVKNCVSSLYLDESVSASVGGRILRRPSALAIGFVGRDYLHKNTNVLPEVRRILREVYFLDVDFFVTFTQGEWLAKDSEFREAVTNVGELSVAQCPEFYRQMDAVIFPSLLECFSATPLEALAMKRPLFASDRGFVSDVCGSYAFYFDPLDAASIAKSISSYFSRGVGYDVARLEAGRAYAINFSSAESRAVQYVQLIDNLVSQLAGRG